ncbi:MAG: adenylate/guanylate cyclase domain-containing protein [Vicinamibacterales bacterium]
MALDAIRCALEIQRAVRSEAALDGVRLSVGVGIATGDVLVGSVGSSDRMDYTAIGPAVNLGSRLCAAAEAGQILLCADTVSRIGALVAARPLPPMPLKGLGEVTVYEMRSEF